MKKAINHCLVFVFILFGSCSLLESEEEKREGEAVELDNQDLNLSIFEIVTINLPEGQFSNGEIEGNVEGETIDLTIFENTMTFMVPKLNQGSYKLVFQEKNKPYNIAFQVKAHSLKETPANYIQTYLDKSQNQVDRMEKTKDLLVGEKKIEMEKDIAILKKFLDEQYAKAALLKDNELAEMAFFIEANKEWMDELSAAVNELNASFPNARIAGEVVTNIEALGNRVSGKYVASVVKVVKYIRKIAIAVSIGFLAGSFVPIIGSSVGAAIGLGISVGNMLLDIKELLANIESVADFVQVVADNILEFNLRTVYSFQNNESTELFVSRNYRTVYSEDVNSTVPYVTAFMGAVKTMITEWEKLKSKIPLDFAFIPTDYTAISTYKTTNRRVHSDQLSLGEITNPKVSAEITKEDGKLFIKFSSNEDLVETFRFYLIYDYKISGLSVFGNIEFMNEATLTAKVETITDPRDGNVYKVIRIGTQTWFTENLRYSGGITQVPSESAWAGMFVNSDNVVNPTKQPAWSYYNNNPGFDAIYGKLYNWYAVATGSLCPPGWHIPSEEEWTTLSNYLGGDNVSGGKIKSVTGWSGTNIFATNQSGFSALPAGYRTYLGVFEFEGYVTHWWSSTEENVHWAPRRVVYAGEGGNNDGRFGKGILYKNYGLSCRCIKD
ncbi:fibrobacter succinogenes major paralogous domain-containing protein [Aquiflexum gelatinilyticum]|uniref:fibrobacter succinogenes major paralogous domain-containing protein n=1 Tax=Aquiflexum gelatinilyticum TaxID=2961943 RepID=UPI002166FA21|nr:fibrobacter succinogenes major paralogous domain-containing protein [Aquiflexum gelatinilyticum]MCS4434194.1 fibrobacter succinogenes major paralogous domain-containing protein [Aquiflexum gelatinilyticum]